MFAQLMRQHLTSSDGWTRLVTASLAHLQTLHNESQQTRLESNIRVLAKLLDIVKCQCSVSDEAPSPSETRLLLDAVLACHQATLASHQTSVEQQQQQQSADSNDSTRSAQLNVAARRQEIGVSSRSTMRIRLIFPSFFGFLSFALELELFVCVIVKVQLVDKFTSVCRESYPNVNYWKN